MEWLFHQSENSKIPTILRFLIDDSYPWLTGETSKTGVLRDVYRSCDSDGYKSNIILYSIKSILIRISGRLSLIVYFLSKSKFHIFSGRIMLALCVMLTLVYGSFCIFLQQKFCTYFIEFYVI